MKSSLQSGKKNNTHSIHNRSASVGCNSTNFSEVFTVCQKEGLLPSAGCMAFSACPCFGCSVFLSTPPLTPNSGCILGHVGLGKVDLPISVFSVACWSSFKSTQGSSPLGGIPWTNNLLIHQQAGLGVWGPMACCLCFLLSQQLLPSAVNYLLICLSPSPRL